MAGIVGITGEKGTHTHIKKMLKILRHRGPDRTVIRRTALGAAGYISVDNSTEGVSSGQDPLVIIDGYLNRTGTDWQHTSDADYLKELYIKHGKQAFSMIQGSFSCAVMDDRECILLRDSVGARPLIYHTNDSGELFFSSEAKSMTDYTLSAEELLPGYYYSSREGLKPFASSNPYQHRKFGSPEEAVKTVRDLVVQAVEQLVKRKSIEGVALSGGLDSSIILAIAKEFNSTIAAFTTTLSDIPGEDLHYAEMMAGYVGAPLHTYRITQTDLKEIIPKAVYFLESFDEDCISGFIANYYTSRMTSRFMNSVLVGEGADELFGGYFRELDDISNSEEQERVGLKLLHVAYNTSLRRLDRGWMANSVEYYAPFLDPSVTAAAQAVSMDLKVRNGIEKWVLREAFRDMLPREIADRPKLRFARGVGVDEMMDQVVAEAVESNAVRQNPVSAGGIALNSPKEYFYYQLFQKYFPSGYESLTCRWDPFK